METRVRSSAKLPKRVRIVGVEKLVCSTSLTETGSAATEGKVPMRDLNEFKNLATSSFVKLLMREQCSACKVADPGHRHHVPWDEVELKKHCLLNTECQRYAQNPPKDEFEMRRLGYLNTHCDRHSRPDLQHPAPSSAASAAEEVQKGLPKALLSEYGEKSWVEHKIVSSEVQRSLEPLAHVNDENDSSSPSSCTLLSGGFEEVVVADVEQEAAPERTETESTGSSKVNFRDARGSAEEKLEKLLPWRKAPLEPPPFCLQENRVQKTKMAQIVNGRPGIVTWQQKETVESGAVKVFRFDFNARIGGNQEETPANKE